MTVLPSSLSEELSLSSAISFLSFFGLDGVACLSLLNAKAKTLAFFVLSSSPNTKQQFKT